MSIEQISRRLSHVRFFASFYKALLPEDLDAIVAYLRTVNAVRNTVAEPEYKMPVHHQPRHASRSAPQ
jgi:hypothetical protein